MKIFALAVCESERFVFCAELGLVSVWALGQESTRHSTLRVSSFLHRVHGSVRLRLIESPMS